MYGLLQTSATNSEFPQNVNFPFLVDPNIQHAAISAAASLNVMENIQSFGHLYGINSTFPASNMQAQTTFDEDHPSTSMQTYSHPTSNLSQTSQSSNQSQIVLSLMDGRADGTKANYVQNNSTTFDQSIEEFTDFDLEDFQDILLDKNTSSFNQSKSVNNAYLDNVQVGVSKNLDAKINEQPCASYRYDELANADKELDRLVSLVANQNQRSDIKSENVELIRCFPHESNATSTRRNSFHTLQFTPPDSPPIASHPCSSRDVTNEHSFQFDKITPFNSPINANVQPIITPKTNCSSSPNERKERYEIDQVRLSRLALTRKKNTSKVPIYKQSINMSLSSNTSDIQTKSVSKTNNSSFADAYNFEDEFEEKPLLTTLNIINKQKSQPISDRNLQESHVNHQKTKRKYTRKTDNANSFTLPTETEARKEENKQIAKLLDERIRGRQICKNIFSEILPDNNVVVTDAPIATCTLKNETIKCETSDTACQKLPKLIIRIPRRDSTETVPNTSEILEDYHKKRKKKKKKKDIDWTESDECHFINKHKKHEHKKHRRSHRKHDRDDKEYRHGNDAHIEPFNLSQDHEESTISNLNTCDDRLHCFEKPTEHPKKGTFLLSKEEIFSDECALWRIDNQNLLQKYIPFLLQEGTICYKNSQTYSGWCEGYAEKFMAVKVHYIKQSRSENIVKPFVPLHDLFPAINVFINDSESFVFNGKQDEKVDNVNNQALDYLNTFIKIMLKHCITLDFIQTIRRNNDLKYLGILNKIEMRVTNCIERIRVESQWTQPLIEALNNFSQLYLTDFDTESDVEQSCQACLTKSFNVKQVVQLYSNQIFDCEKLLPIEKTDLQSSTIDFYVCHRCADLIQKYHNVYHLRLTVFKCCEEKIESMIALQNGFPIDQIEEHCIADNLWIDELCKVISKALQS